MKYNLNCGTTTCVISYWLFAVTMFCFSFPVKIFAQGGQTVLNGNFTMPINVPSTGCGFKWTNPNLSIGLAASGTGNIAPFKAVNNTARSITDTVLITSVPERQFAYLGNSKDKTLSIANLVDNSIITTLPINSEVWSTAVSADDKIVYISSESQDFITVFDAVNNKIDHVIPLQRPDPSTTNPAAAWGMALSTDGKHLYAPNTTGSGIYAIDLKSNPEKVTVILVPIFGLPTVTNTGDVYTLLTNDDGSKLYGSFGIYDVASNKVVDTTGLLSCYDMVFSPDHSKIYTTSRPNVNQAGLDVVNTVKIYDVASRTYTTFKIQAKGGFGNLAISPDGNTLYADNFFYDNVSVIDLPSQSLKGNVSIGNTHKGISVGLGGSRLYVVNSNGGTAVIDTKTLQMLPKNILAGGTVISFGKFTTTGACYAEPTTYVITVEPTPPTINEAGTLPAMQSVYGTPSVSTSITVSGTNVSEGVLINPPDGFEVSTDNITFSNAVTVPPVGAGVSPAMVYVRLKANSPAKSYVGDVVISSAGNVTGSIKVSIPQSTITPAQLTISAKTVNKTYGSTYTKKTDSVNFTVTGLQNGDAISAVTLTYAAGGAATDGVNIYPGSVTPSAPAGTAFLASNYTNTYNAADLLVVPAPLTITANDKSRVYDDPNPALTFTYKGFVNNEDAGQLTKLPTISTSAAVLSAVGEYPIVVTGASASNYAMIYVNGLLTITPLKLILTSAITPNNDGINDTWEIKAIGQYPNCIVKIMNRYGQQVFYSVGYGKPWDGKFKGVVLPVGTYYYVINLSKGMRPLAGYLTLIK